MTGSNSARTRFIWLCLSPAVILMAIFMLYPVVSVFQMSLYKWGGYSPDKQFVGFDNFKILAGDMNFIRSFQNTILLIVVVTVFTLAFALVFAAILTRVKFKGIGLFRVIFYIPNILSIVVISAMFSAIYDPTQGLLNSFLRLFHPANWAGIQWLGNEKIVIFSLAITLIWQAIGYYMVMYMSSMASIPEDLYESSALDGAGVLKQFFSITLPLTWSTIRTTLTFFVISTINLSFLLVTAMTGGGPNGSTEVFLSYMYKQANTNSAYGYGMAIGVVVFGFSFILSAVLQAITKRDIYEF
ncbi:carbohydrate ABC transporter permease [Lacticaseibacillus brantae]|nr:sugar ABC transporter permease [Lacticaseibacillus brantae]